MQTMEFKTIDKSTWARGPWDKEPDKKQWMDMETGLPCLIVRSESSGGLCGYVGVDERHPLFEGDYDDPRVDVHGGLTYASFCQPEDEAKEHGICHIVENGDNDRVWWFGFDTAHAFDLCPGRNAILAQCRADLYTADDKRSLDHLHTSPIAGETYRDWEYVEEEVTALARQLKELAA